MNTDEQASQIGAIGVFNRAASNYDSHGPRFFSQLGRRLVEVARVTPGTKVLDIAAGRGAVLFPAADQVGPKGSVVGIDLAENMVVETKGEIERTRRQNVRMLQMSADQLDFPDASFDFVLCGFALWFFPKPEITLQEIFRVLEPGGCLALTTWDKNCPFLVWVRREIQASLPPEAPPPSQATDRPRFDAPEKIEPALRQVGFTDIEIRAEERDFVYATDDDWWASLWSHGIRSRFERLEPAALEKLKSEMIGKVQVMKQADGIHTLWRALFARAHKPSL
jgi:O-methyltransferase/aklanonic acid methyltransferase